ncbi:hypothetical protein EVAR_94476_1 [Eumeta japonica]|uniref:Reverse transcriptase domain-containing protein n=1 Tax=Eumeta variegata TaxID=151549 RepID=A0A4C1UUQ3_EUMVA|nr:hypothetical protein EVAR_94476_1 [Eumeta japonica]
MEGISKSLCKTQILTHQCALVADLQNLFCKVRIDVALGSAAQIKGGVVGKQRQLDARRRVRYIVGVRGVQKGRERGALRNSRSYGSPGRIILMVSLDIEGAFDNAWWPALETQLRALGCPVNLHGLVRGYLRDREPVQPLEPYPGFPTRELGELGVYVQAFADDVVLMFSGQSASSIEEEANRALARVHCWEAYRSVRFVRGHRRRGSSACEDARRCPAQRRSEGMPGSPYSVLHSALILARLLPLTLGKGNWPGYTRLSAERFRDTFVDRELETRVFRRFASPARVPEIGYESVGTSTPDGGPSRRRRAAHFTDGSRIEAKSERP